MPVRLRDGDLELEFDTPAEAAEYRAQINRQTLPKRSRPGRAADPRSSTRGTGWEAFCTALAQRTDDAARRMRKLLALVKGRGEAGLTWSEVTKALSLSDDNKAYGTYSGLAKALKAAHLTPGDVLIVGKDKRLRPGPLLVANDPPTP